MKNIVVLSNVSSPALVEFINKSTNFELRKLCVKNVSPVYKMLSNLLNYESSKDELMIQNPQISADDLVL